MRSHSAKPSEKLNSVGANPLQKTQFAGRLFHPRFASDLQSGQAIVLMALMMLGLMAILGLSIDGGGLFFLNRDTQNATDAAVIAATYARCTSNDPAVVEFAGYQAAARNGFDNNTTSNWVVVNNPPDSGTGVGESEYVEVTITAAKPSYFIQLVFPEPLRVTSRAVGRCSPPFNPATLPALYGLTTTCPTGVSLSGSNFRVESSVYPTIRSNYDISGTGGGDVVGGAVARHGIDISTQVTFTPPGVIDPNMNTDDPLSEHFSPSAFIDRYWNDPNFPIHTEIGPGSPDFNINNNTWRPNGRTLEGLYYVHGDVAINNATYGTHGVTIVADGAVDFASAANVYNYVGGFLVIANKTADNCGDDAVHISGSAQWYGMIYAPNAGATISGSNQNVIGGFVAQTIEFSGSRTRIVYDPDLLDPFPANVTVSE